jgi:predicted Fe-Mo cluster-binding NifX family protein
MKVAITADEGRKDSPVSQRFARCGYWCFADTETGEISCEENRFKNDMHGAGSEAGEFLTERGVQAVITGRVGPNARRVLDAANIATYAGGGRSVGDALKALREGSLETLS